MGRSARILALVPVIGLLGWSAAEAVTHGVTASASFNAAQELERVNRAPQPVEMAPWWRDDLKRAAANLPRDPQSRELLALVIQRSTSDPTELADAERHLAAAIQARPGSPYTWANLAQLKYRIGDTGPAFEKALVNAVTLGPYEPEVQRAAADYGLAVMNDVSPVTRAAVERAVAAGMKRNAPEILQIAARRGRLDVACRHLDGVPRPAASKWTQLCQSMEPTP